jgi:hypothetical protein
MSKKQYFQRFAQKVFVGPHFWLTKHDLNKVTKSGVLQEGGVSKDPDVSFINQWQVQFTERPFFITRSKKPKILR